VALAASSLLTSCAVVEAPPGGPEDVEPPRLAGFLPDSAATGLGEVTRLTFTFSEKMNRKSAQSWLTVFPDRKIRGTKWRGARIAEVEFFEPLPADTVIVVEVAGGMDDAHKVKNKRSRRYPIATGDSIPDGRITGSLILADSALTSGVVELLPAGPDSVPLVQRPVLRRAVTDRTGHYALEWLPADGEAWLLRAFADKDGNLRATESDPQRLLPDTLRLHPGARALEVGALTLYTRDTPGSLVSAAFTAPDWAAPLRAWSMVVAEEDTGWAPGGPGPRRTWPLDPAGGSVVDESKPGPQRIVVFVDVDADTTFSAVAGSLLSALPDTCDPDGWYFEPWWQIEGPEVEPGLPSDFVFAPGAAAFTSTTAPDTSAAAPDSLQALVDSLLTAPAAPDGKD
jgi:hypothetical protein